MGWCVHVCVLVCACVYSLEYSLLSVNPRNYLKTPHGIFFFEIPFFFYYFICQNSLFSISYDYLLVT